MRPARLQHHRAGFTLIELMVIVIIIAVGAALAAPAVHSARAEAVTNRLSLNLIRLHRVARAEALMYGRAHLVRFDRAGRGTFRAFRGINSNCNTNVWTTSFGGPACGVAGSFCIDSYDLADSQSLGDTRFDATSDAGFDSVDVCYEPTGRMLWRADVAPTINGGFSDQNQFGGTSLNGGFRFVFTRRDDGVVEGVPRIVVVPLGGESFLLR